MWWHVQSFQQGRHREMDRQMIRIITASTVLAHNVTQENKKIHYHTTLPSVLWHCWLGGRKGIWPVKNMGQWWRLALVVRMEWRPVGGSVSLPLLISPCIIKSRSSLLAPAHLGGPGKRAVKWLWWCGIIQLFLNAAYNTRTFQHQVHSCLMPSIPARLQIWTNHFTRLITSKLCNVIQANQWQHLFHTILFWPFHLCFCKSLQTPNAQYFYNKIQHKLTQSS